MTADFAEEHSTSTLAAERIDAETSERMRLERELQDVTEANKNLQQTTERLEMELLYARAADLNGIVSDGEDGEDGGVYKQRYEHAMRELEFTKRKMAQQHEDDLEQLVGLKKQLEKKVSQLEFQSSNSPRWKRQIVFNEQKENIVKRKEKIMQVEKRLYDKHETKETVFRDVGFCDWSLMSAGGLRRIA